MVAQDPGFPALSLTVNVKVQVCPAALVVQLKGSVPAGMFVVGRLGIEQLLLRLPEVSASEAEAM